MKIRSLAIRAALLILALSLGSYLAQARFPQPKEQYQARRDKLRAQMDGPVALFAIEPGSQTITHQQLLAAQRIGSSSAWEVATDTGKIRMIPYPAIQNETYRLYHQT